MTNEKWWKEAVGRLLPGHVLMVKGDGWFGPENFPWKGNHIHTSMEETHDLWITKYECNVVRVPKSSPKEIYLWLLRNDWLVDDDILVPELKEM